MPLQPSRRDTVGPPGDNVSNLAARVRHQGSYLRSLDPGILEGRFATPKPVPKGAPRQLVGGDAAGDDTDYAWEWDDRHTVTSLGTQVKRLSHIPIDETLHVRWHPGGRGGRPLTNELFTVDDQIVTIPDTGILAVGDQFSFQYEYEVGDDVLDFEFIAVVGGVYHADSHTMTFTMPPEAQAGDFLVAAVRGGVAAGGGDITLGVTSGDARLSVLYTAALPVIQVVLTGFATTLTTDVVTNIIPSGSFPTGGGNAVMAVFRGINNVAVLGSLETAGATPQVAGSGAIAVTWNGNATFTVLDADPPSGYTDAGDSGTNYGATDISYWSDPDAEISPAGTFTGEGCLVIGLT